jgi:hypothetical protein
MGLWVSKERKRGRGEDRFWGWGAAMDCKKLDFHCVCLGLLFYLYQARFINHKLRVGLHFFIFYLHAIGEIDYINLKQNITVQL